MTKTAKTTTKNDNTPKSKTNSDTLSEPQSYCVDCGIDGTTKYQPYRGVYLCSDCHAVDMDNQIEEHDAQ